MSRKNKPSYQCQSCAHMFAQWHGQCPHCHVWDGILPASTKTEAQHWTSTAAPKALSSITHEDIHERVSTGLSELDRVLGQGVTVGSCILLGGDPGIGKSTLLLQMVAHLPAHLGSLYVSGEESQNQLGMRARRLGLTHDRCHVMAETRLQKIIEQVEALKPHMVIIDSIQTLYDEELPSSCGSVAQIRECTHQLLRHCKQRGITLWIIGHVTKDGALAGPRVLEHMVDTVLYFEGERSSRYRMIRAMKNRFGPAHEMGLFGMSENGLKSISHPSKIFLQEGPLSPGRAITALWEGSRVLLVELQVLAAPSYGEHPRRVSVGFDLGRLNLLLAVAARELKLPIQSWDIFVNVVGGIKIQETSADLALLAALLSSHRDQALGNQLVIFGEVGLGGEIRPATEGQLRMQEAEKQGFEHCWAPKRNRLKAERIQITAVEQLRMLLQLIGS